MKKFRNLIGMNSADNGVERNPQIATVPKNSSSPTETTTVIASSTQEVLSTSELLSLIFHHLSPSLLVFCAKRVCRAWYNVLSTPSPGLQVSLFLRPAPSNSPLFTQPTFNDLLTSAFPFWLLNKRQLPRPGICSCSPNKCGRFSTSTSLALVPWKRNPEAWQRNQYWRQMLVMQPPCTKAALLKATDLKVTQPDWRSSMKNRSHFAVDCPGGLTMGVLYDIVEDWIREANNVNWVSEYKEKKQEESRAWDGFEAAWDRGEWIRKELYLCDKETGQLLFLHLDLDRYSLDQV